jgi:hypothetical protein
MLVWQLCGVTISPVSTLAVAIDQGAIISRRVDGNAENIHPKMEI